ncbi:interleukin-20 receptor subunit beta [Protopterus annectens]|uniref:interleukin-20 receptor subunit beta n=1 Tax=Protopterus annectens TaxID=7888 RepID=UPI001CFA4CF2|nr:interleukin-20 receptor subunit beta [Protopterus annectens]
MCFNEVLFWSWITIFIFLCLTSSIHTETNRIPAPQNVSMNSTNMNHFLLWSPVIVLNMEVKYTVEFQGEFERSTTPHIWVTMCESINVTSCNMMDFAANIDYNIRVRAELHNSTSEWTFIKQLFNLQNTHLTDPSVTVTPDGNALIATFDPLQIPFPNESIVKYMLYYWKSNGNSSVHSKTLTSIQYSERVQDDEEGVEYCFRGQTYVEIINCASNYSTVVCAIMPKTSFFWIVGSVIMVICLFTAFFALFSFSSLIRRICLLIKHSCCPQIEIPDALIIDFLPTERQLQNGQRNDVCETVYILTPNVF